MDTQQFRKISKPDYYSDYKNVKVNFNKFANLPTDITPDNRYHNWAAKMSDGRLATDYTNHCSKNIPAGSQFPTKRWLQNNGQSVIDYSRKHQFPVTRALDISVVPPPAQILKITKYDSKLQNSGQPSGIGVEREQNVTPELFGTFAQVSYEEKPKTYMTTNYYEGGRNTPRGTYNNLVNTYNLKKNYEYK